MPFFSHYSLRWQVIAVAVLPLLLLVVILLVHAREIQVQHRGEKEQQLRQSARQIQESLGDMQKQANQAARFLTGSQEVIQAFVDHDNDLLFRWGSRLIDSGLASEVYFIDAKGVVLARGHDEMLFNDRLPADSPLYIGSNASIPSGIQWMNLRPSMVTALPVLRFDVQALGHVIVVLSDLDKQLDQLGRSHNIKIALSSAMTSPENGLLIPLTSVTGEALELRLETNDEGNAKGIEQIITSIFLLGGSLLIILPFLVSFFLNYLLSPLARLQFSLQGSALAPTEIGALVEKIRGLGTPHNEIGAITKQISETLLTLQEAEEQLLQSQKMVALGSLVAGVSHELNTPIGNCYLIASSLWERLKTLRNDIEIGALKRSALDNFLAECNLACEILDRNLSSAAGLIRSFKQISVDQTGDQRRNFDLRQLIEDSTLTLLPSLKRVAGLRIENLVPEDILLDSFPGALSQIITNLLQNAALHGLEDKEEGLIRITAEQDGELISLQVSDNGCGILPERINRIFDPFFTTRLGQGGSGLGLHICYTLAGRPLGGKITVSSTVGEGSVFTLRFPVAPPQAIQTSTV